MSAHTIRKKGVRKALFMALAFVVVAVAILPNAWLALTSLKTEREAFTMPPQLIFRPIVDNYVTIFTRFNFDNYLVNSLMVGLLSTAGALLLGTPAAYAMARFRFTGKRQLSLYVLSTRIAPPVLVILPMYLIFGSLGLLDNYLSLAAVQIAYNLAFVFWMMSSFFGELPEELDDAAQVDGCSRFRAFWRIDLPIVAPGLAATAIFIFVQSWNEFITALVFTGNATKTLPVAITSFMTAQGTLWGPMAAAGTTVMLPMLVFGLAVQRYLVRGLTMGAIK
ncbi:carbohydrate ABC transporter permease [Limnochorda pilosa]|uniref:Transporter n=1 Tax=Limnochorda pilosa TaxID=1555112 RepID=A0A0K2SM46_LIMPI|nr:carbohydrate ABC transporter permease [Limnochorda pilosa]BAS28181.1 transporter [Limnochorda pilosa]